MISLGLGLDLGYVLMAGVGFKLRMTLRLGIEKSTGNVRVTFKLSLKFGLRL